MLMNESHHQSVSPYEGPARCLRVRRLLAVIGAALISSAAIAATTVTHHRTFATAQAAADALVAAAEQYDVPALLEILGPEGKDLVVSEDPVLDKNLAAEFAKQAKEKTTVVPDKANPKKATVIVGPDDWPLPIPIVENEGRWKFDTVAGKREILMRRIGRNELDAIEICHGYVEAQNEYASAPRGGSEVPQYAQRVIGNAEKQDGLAWHDKDGTWRGPIGEKIAGAIAEGYLIKNAPYHGYYFKVLKGQGPAAPLGQLDYVVNGLMIGGFALVAAPADYRVTGVKTFIVSNDGVVYEKDLGPHTLEAFRAMERFNPDDTWSPVQDQ
jgi:hypothetical protein